MPSLQPSQRRATRPVRRVLLVGLLSGFALLAVGVVAAATFGCTLSCRCPLPGDSFRCLAAGDLCGLIALGLLIVLITPPLATLAVAAGFLRARQTGWALLAGLVAVVAGMVLLSSLQKSKKISGAVRNLTPPIAIIGYHNDGRNARPGRRSSPPPAGTTIAASRVRPLIYTPGLQPISERCTSPTQASGHDGLPARCSLSLRARVQLLPSRASF
jgi:hypothetical protein